MKTALLWTAWAVVLTVLAQQGLAALLGRLLAPLARVFSL